MDLITRRVSVVTGGSSGIGEAVVKMLLERGESVCIWDLNPPVYELSVMDEVFYIKTDVTDSDQVSSAVSETIDRFEKIDVLINNAGILGKVGSIEILEENEWDRVLNINLKSAYLTIKRSSPYIRKSTSGRIVNVASVAGKEGNINMSAYSASKAGLIGLTKSVAKELANSGVLVNAITPALTKTSLLKGMTGSAMEVSEKLIPLNRLAEPNEIAAMICWLSSVECSFSTGAVFDVSGGRASS
ncbi:SDR family NAD(P)-dependent oxidoreductase [Halomonas sp. HAL1]|uniref:SDR family NAD(P)-dependent oxidoreductase n=1 Tax=Halomonas sp. HAL1 TaxID=550984 RepID=UPI000556EB3F|nr:SDR family NAD(P)-dependent oxidoreductase [Halomonas sp. HAL1]WKV91620.1 SDR family NAD(P)-dependent oxidoreductase [Halomonas sp. HAL1]